MNKFLTQLRHKWGRDNSIITPHMISFDIAPKINSVFRNGNPELQEQMFNAFIGEGNADEAIKMMAKCHKKQTALIKKLYDGAMLHLIKGKNYVAAAIPAEYRAYTGLLAGRLSGEFNCPAFVLREENSTLWSGSMRSPVNILNLINSSGIAKCQGHEQAAGILIKKCNLRKFFAWLDEQYIDVNNTVIEVAAALDRDDITLELCQEIQNHAYLFGNDLPMPQFYTQFYLPADANCLCGKSNNTFRQPPFLKFRCSDDEIELLNNGKDKTIAAIIELSVNSYGGNDYPQAMIKKWEIIVNDDCNAEIDWETIFS